MTDVIIKLVIPGLFPNDNDFGIFEDEPQAFAEIIFCSYYTGNEVKIKISQFLDNLSK